MCGSVRAVGRAQAASCDGGHYPIGPRRRNFANGVVEFVGHKNVARIVHRDSRWIVELGGVVGAILGTGNPCLAGDGGYHPIGSHRCDFSDRIIELVRHIEIGCAVQRNSGGAGKLGAGVGAVERSLGATGDGGHYPVRALRCDFTDAVVLLIGDIEIPGAVNRHSGGIVKLRVGIVAVKRSLCSTGDGGEGEILSLKWRGTRPFGQKASGKHYYLR